MQKGRKGIQIPQLQYTIVEKRQKPKTLINQEEAEPIKRSKVAWLNLEDSNTKFFSITIGIKKSKNSTLRILNIGVSKLSLEQP